MASSSSSGSRRFNKAGTTDNTTERPIKRNLLQFFAFASNDGFCLAYFFCALFYIVFLRFCGNAGYSAAACSQFFTVVFGIRRHECSLNRNRNRRGRGSNSKGKGRSCQALELTWKAEHCRKCQCKCLRWAALSDGAHLERREPYQWHLSRKVPMTLINWITNFKCPLKMTLNKYKRTNNSMLGTWLAKRIAYFLASAGRSRLFYKQNLK